MKINSEISITQALLQKILFISLSIFFICGIIFFILTLSLDNKLNSLAQKYHSLEETTELLSDANRDIYKAALKYQFQPNSNFKLDLGYSDLESLLNGAKFERVSPTGKVNYNLFEVFGEVQMISSDKATLILDAAKVSDKGKIEVEPQFFITIENRKFSPLVDIFDIDGDFLARLAGDEIIRNINIEAIHSGDFIEIGDREGNLAFGIYNTKGSRIYYQGYFHAGKEIVVIGLNGRKIIPSTSSKAELREAIEQVDLQGIVIGKFSRRLSAGPGV